MKSKILKKFVFLFSAAFLFIASLTAEMETSERLAIIKALKSKGIVGENNAGYLEFKGQEQAQDVVNEENDIRKQAYQKIASDTKVSIEKIGNQRAAQLAAESPAGAWIQSPDGQWKKK